MDGIDVSYCQRCFPWGRYDGGFAMIKASQGKSQYGSYAGDFIEDSEYRRNAAGATAEGVPWGAYHYLTARNTGEAHAEAARFCSVLAERRDDMRLWAAVDVESTRWLPDEKTVLTAVVREFCAEVACRGFKPMVYSGPSFIGRRFDLPAGVPLWLALWGKESAAKRYDPVIWQYGMDQKYGVDGDIGYFTLPGLSETDAGAPVYAVGGQYKIRQGDKYTNGWTVPARLVGRSYEIGKVKEGAVYLPALWSWVRV